MKKSVYVSLISFAGAVLATDLAHAQAVGLRKAAPAAVEAPSSPSFRAREILNSNVDAVRALDAIPGGGSAAREIEGRLFATLELHNAALMKAMSKAGITKAAFDHSLAEVQKTGPISKIVPVVDKSSANALLGSAVSNSFRDCGVIQAADAANASAPVDGALVIQKRDAQMQFENGMFNHFGSAYETGKVSAVAYANMRSTGLSMIAAATDAEGLMVVPGINIVQDAYVKSNFVWSNTMDYLVNEAHVPSTIIYGTVDTNGDGVINMKDKNEDSLAIACEAGMTGQASSI